MTQILHIIQQLSKGGAARAMIATAKYSAQYDNFYHQVISLLPSETLAKQQAEAVGMLVIDKPDRQTILNTIEKADIVHVHWWNNPHLYELLRSDLPSMRLLTWFHVAGDQPPHVITKQLIDHSDFVIPCNPYSYNLPVFQELFPEIRKEKVGMVYDATDFQRIGEFKKRSHDGFNVGYIGTVDFVKMHPNYVSMSAKVNIPDVRFVVCGGGISDYLAQQAQQLGALEKFDFRGYVEDIKSVLEILDIYGYPLCEETYAAAELNLQEVMYCAIPPVVFPYGGVKNLIQHNETGLIVNSEKEYKEAIEYLYHNPQERERLGNNARKYALEIFGAENAGKAINPIYEKLMQQPKKERIWGIPVGMSLLNLPITLEDLTGEYRQPTPAELFIEGLGGTKPEFIVSMTSQDINELFEAEEKIAFSSPLVRSAGSGGIIHYSKSYPNDGYLRLWTGLVLDASQQFPQAIQNYISAINLGCNHWRVAWYLARVAEKANNLELAEKAVRNVLQAVPNFINAQKLLNRITNRNLFPFNFQTLNLIIFPDWQQDEEELSLTLTKVLRAIASHPLAQEITLIIDITNVESEEDAQMLVSAMTMNLILEEGIELPETAEITFIGNLTSQEWEKLFNLVQYRVKLDTEYLPIYVEKLSSCQIQDISNLPITISESDLLDINFQSLNLIIFPDWQQEEEELSLILTEVLRAIASHPQAEEITLIIDITNVESEEDAQMLVSAVTMNLILEEGIELSETTEIAFIGNLTPQEWQKIIRKIDYRISISPEILPQPAQSLPVYDYKIHFPKISPITEKLNQRPFWSVMIPTYSKFEYLEQTLRSVLAQAPNQDEMQIEVVNDHPDKELQDRMEALVKQIAGERVLFYRHTEIDIGQTAIFNLCLERARGHWIHLLHDDDYILPNFYSKLKRGIDNNLNIGAVFCRHNYIDENDHILFSSAMERETEGILENNWLEKIIISQRIQPSSILVNRKVYEKLGGFCPQAKSAADWEMWKRVCRYYSIWYEPEILACYRLHQSSWTSRLLQTGGNILDTLATINISAQYLPHHIRDTLSQQAKKHYANYALNTTQKMLVERNKEGAIAQIKAGLQCSHSPDIVNKVIELVKIAKDNNSNNSFEDTEIPNNDIVSKLLSLMIENNNQQILETLSQIQELPEWFIDTYISYLLTPPSIFPQEGDAEKYLQYYQNLVNSLHNNIFSHQESQQWQKIAVNFAQKAYMIPCYFNEHNLKDLYKKRAEIIEFALELQGHSLDYQFSASSTPRQKIHLGILAAHYSPQTETFTTIPFYKHLDRDIFHITLYTVSTYNHRLEGYCSGHADQSVILPKSLKDKVDRIREDDLDIILIATNVTARTNVITTLAAHRLAKIQILNNSSCTTSGLKNIDYYISGKLTEPENNPQEQYTEKLVMIEGTAHCQDLATEEFVKPTITIQRQDLDITDHQIVFISGANFFKIIPELQKIWIEILKRVPESILILYPYNPNWSNNYPKQQFEQRWNKKLKQEKIDQNRLKILDPVPNYADVRERLKIADIYLDSYPFSSINSLIDPLLVNLPTVVKDGNSFRSLMSASVLRELDVDGLIANNDNEYIEKAILLAQNYRLREEYREKIKQKIQNNPSFLDSKKYSHKIEKIFIDLHQQYQHNNILREYNLTNINYLIFPDWQTDEESLTEELYNLISSLANNSPLIKGGRGGSNPAPSGKKTNAENIITLVIDTTDITEEDANLFLSGVAMNLMMEEDLDLENILNFSFIDNLEESQWQKILQKITAKITLNCDNQEMLNNPLFEDLITITADRTNYAVFTDWSIDEQKLFTTFSDFLKNIPTQEKANLLINLNHSNEEEVGLFVSEVVMNLMLEEEIDLSENVRINFVNFTPTQWGSLEGLIKEKLTINN